jgi:hypothetical protein
MRRTTLTLRDPDAAMERTLAELSYATEAATGVWGFHERVDAAAYPLRIESRWAEANGTLSLFCPQ